MCREGTLMPAMLDQKSAEDIRNTIKTHIHRPLYHEHSAQSTIKAHTPQLSQLSLSAHQHCHCHVARPPPTHPPGVAVQRTATPPSRHRHPPHCRHNRHQPPGSGVDDPFGLFLFGWCCRQHMCCPVVSLIRRCRGGLSCCFV